MCFCNGCSFYQGKKKMFLLEWRCMYISNEIHITRPKFNVAANMLTQDFSIVYIDGTICSENFWLNLPMCVRLQTY